MIEFLNKYKTIFITLGVGLLMCLGILFLNGCFSAETTLELMKDLCDGFSISGFLLIAFGLMTLIGNEGTFSILSYGTKKLISLFKKDVYVEDYYTYKTKRIENKSPYIHLLVSGAILFVIGLVFLIIFNCMYE